MPLLGLLGLLDGPQRVEIVKPFGVPGTDVLSLDVTVNLAPQYASTVTKNPIETGGVMSDHIDLQPKKLSVAGIITDSPSIFLAFFRQGSEKPSQRAYTFLEGIATSRETVHVFTPFGDFLDMVMVGFNPTKDKSTGRALRFTANFEEARFANSASLSLAAAAKTAAGSASKKQLGKKPAAPVTQAADPQKTKTLLKGLTDIGRAFLGGA